jgi:hypothetical protein
MFLFSVILPGQTSDATDAGVQPYSLSVPSSCNLSADEAKEEAKQSSPSASWDSSSDASLNQGCPCPPDDWVHRWLRRVDEARASQPHFPSPIVTTHVLLVQQYRYDMSWQRDPRGTITANYGASRGLEIIPNTHMEVGVFPPPYIVNQSTIPDGFGDFSGQVKFRLASEPEGKGDYFVGFFFGGSFPTGTPPNGLGHGIVSPTFAAAKGVGPWDIQSTIGGNLPTSGTDLLGRTIIFNTAVDYKIKGVLEGVLWPMLEQNSTFWFGGILDGKKEVFLTPGLILGSYQIAERLHFTFGGGVQIAATHFHQFNHRYILSVRFPF